jgi:dTDP-4-dehydrorhamnose 3,5-epimerase
VTDQLGPIEGVIVRPLERFPDARGTVMHGVRSDTILNDFGEVYFKKLYHDIINGWHVHETLILNFMCVFGMIKLVLYDMREDSPTKSMFQEVCFGDDNHCLIHIPPGIANASQGLARPFSIMVNVASEPHDPDLKYRRINPRSDEIPYDWTRGDY